MEQIEKNTVSAKNQLKKNNHITYVNPDGKGIKVLFVGNSITRHGIAPHIGWNNDFGMAASSIDKDYVHRIISKVQKDNDKDASFCICQASEWEVNFRDYENQKASFEEARDFDADIIIMRIIENVRFQDGKDDIFYEGYGDFIDYLNKSGKAKIIITTAFWNHPFNGMITKYAEAKSLPLVRLEDLGEDDSMKAIGLFEHEGVANHPGDKGMEYIANRIYEKMF